MPKDNVCYCGEYGGGVHTKSARCVGPRPSKDLSIAPCPFCGATNVSVVEGDTFRWRIAQCNECEARAPMVRIQTMGEGTPVQWEEKARLDAIAEWNKRHTPEPRACLCDDSLSLLQRMRDEYLARGDLSGRITREADALIERLSNRVGQPLCTVIPDQVFDGYSVWTELLNDPQARQRTSHENVQDVLNAILRFKRATGTGRDLEWDLQREQIAAGLEKNRGV